MAADVARGHPRGQQQAVRDGAATLVASLLYNSPLAYAAGEPSLLIPPAPEILALLYVLAAARQWRHSLPRLAGSLATAGSLSVSVLWILRIVDAVVISIYDRKFALYLDVGYVGDLITFLDQSGFAGLGWLVIGGLLALFVGLVILCWRLSRRFGRMPPSRPGSTAILTVCATAVLASGALALRQHRAPQVLAPSSVPRLWDELAELGRASDRAEVHERQLQVATTTAESVVRPLDLLDTDLFLFIVESYGYTVLANPVHFNLIDREYAQMETDFAAAGFHVYSHFLDSPAYGGNSWLADATLTTGVRISDQEISSEFPCQ